MNPLTFLYWVLIVVAVGFTLSIVVAFVIVFDAWRARRRIINDYFKKRG